MSENSDAPYLVEVRGDTARRIREDLNGAVDHTVSRALMVGRHGVLVTQHSYNFYTVELSQDVPYGQIQERRVTQSVEAGLN